MTVIAAALTEEIIAVAEKLESGANVNNIIKSLIKETKNIRF